MTLSQLQTLLHASPHSQLWRERIAAGWRILVTCPLGCRDVQIQDRNGVLFWTAHHSQEHAYSTACYWSNRQIPGDAVGKTKIHVRLALPA